jgi:hypothetical protein
VIQSPSDVAVQDSSPVMRNDKEAVEHTEGDRWDAEEVHRCDGFTVILKESLPVSCRFRVLRSSPHPARNSSLRDIKAEFLPLIEDESPQPAYRSV